MLHATKCYENLSDIFTGNGSASACSLKIMTTEDLAIIGMDSPELKNENNIPLSGIYNVNQQLQITKLLCHYMSVKYIFLCP